jgi:hypothetical protein
VQPANGLIRTEWVGDVTDRRGVIAKRAEDLAPGVPYVRGWSDARRAASALAEQLTALGMEADFPGLRADVNVFGDGLVCLGSVRPEAAGLLAELISSSLAVEMAAEADAKPALNDRELPDAPAA